MMICEHGINIEPKLTRAKQPDGQERFFIAMDYCEHCSPKLVAEVPREVEEVIFVPARVS